MCSLHTCLHPQAKYWSPLGTCHHKLWHCLRINPWRLKPDSSSFPACTHLFWPWIDQIYQMHMQQGQDWNWVHNWVVEWSNYVVVSCCLYLCFYWQLKSACLPGFEVPLPFYTELDIDFDTGLLEFELVLLYIGLDQSPFSSVFDGAWLGFVLDFGVHSLLLLNVI